MKSLFITVFALSLSTTVFMYGCRSNSPERISSLQGLENKRISYSTWCKTWQLDCSDISVIDVPIDGLPYSPEQWSSVLRVFNAFLYSPSSFSVTKDSISKPNIKSAALSASKKLGFGEVTEKIFGQIDAGLFETVEKKKNAGLLEIFTKKGLLETDFGISTKTSPSLTVRIDDDSGINVTGVRFEGSNGNGDSLNKVYLNKKNLFTWSGENLTVFDIPLTLAPRIFGVNLEFAQSVLSIGDIIDAAAPLLISLSAIQGELILDEKFWEVFKSNQFALFQDLPDQRIPDTIKVFTDRVISLRSNLIPRSNGVYRFDVRMKRDIRCKIGRGLTAIISADFGITGYEKIPNGIRLKVRGISGSLRLGFFPITVPVTTVDIIGNVISIPNLPAPEITVNENFNFDCRG